MGGYIVAIGGGSKTEKFPKALDGFVVGLAQKADPKALFLPTARKDDPLYIRQFERAYGARLGCQTQVLSLTKKTYSQAELKEAFASADIVYVGGGDTEFMIGLWKQLGVDALLRECYERKAVLAGLSAGSICWFEAGHSDSDQFKKGPQAGFKFVQGLGFLPYWNCPHVDEHPRHEDFLSKLDELKKDCYCFEDFTAGVFYDGVYQMTIKNDPRKHSYVAKVGDSTLTLLR